MPSLMAVLGREIEDRGVEIVYIEKLAHIDKNDNYPIVINPLSSVCVEHWERIKQFISDSPDRRIIMVTPSYSKTELEAIIGAHPNVQIFGHKIDFDLLLRELTE
jgi:hypothetical protein